MGFRQIISSIIIATFVTTTIMPLHIANAAPVAGLPMPGTMVNLSAQYTPLLIKGLKVHPENPLLFDFIVDTGNSSINKDSKELRAESEKLIKYFLATLTIPEKDLWVNLSPYEKDRIIEEPLGQTELGRDMLAQDYMLKQLTASLIYPEKELGKKFWDKIYTQARERFGNANVPVNTFNKVWILPDQADIFVHNNTAFVVGTHLKVMLEEDYLAASKNNSSPPPAGGVRGGVASQMIKEIVIPEIEKEINQGKNFAPLRQIFNSIVLASWYKQNLKQALLNQVYADKSKTNGVDADDKAIKEKIYAQYLQAYKKGVFNYIKDTDAQGTTVPRKYFSGGFVMAVTPNVVNANKVTPAMVASQGNVFSMRTAVENNAAMAAIDTKVSTRLRDNDLELDPKEHLDADGLASFLISENLASQIPSSVRQQIADQVRDSIYTYSEKQVKGNLNANAKVFFPISGYPTIHWGHILMMLKAMARTGVTEKNFTLSLQAALPEDSELAGSFEERNALLDAFGKIFNYHAKPLNRFSESDEEELGVLNISNSLIEGDTKANGAQRFLSSISKANENAEMYYVVGEGYENTIEQFQAWFREDDNRKLATEKKVKIVILVNRRPADKKISKANVSEYFSVEEMKGVNLPIRNSAIRTSFLNGSSASENDSLNYIPLYLMEKLSKYPKLLGKVMGIPSIMARIKEGASTEDDIQVLMRWSSAVGNSINPQEIAEFTYAETENNNSAMSTKQLLKDLKNSNAPIVVEENVRSGVIKDGRQLKALQVLVAIGEQNILTKWDAPGINDDQKRSFLEQVAELDSGYSGGLKNYKENGRRLLKASLEGISPFEGWKPSVPEGTELKEIDDEYIKMEVAGLKAFNRTAGVLVAGGTGDRLGYKGIKVAIPLDLVSMKTYLQHYIETMLAFQEKSNRLNDENRKVPLVIMTSDDTHAQTIKILTDNNFFGMDGLSINPTKSQVLKGEAKQIIILKQGMVPSMVDNDGNFVLDEKDSYKLQVKPHGHGDIHMLIHQAGLDEFWVKEGRTHTFFFQDTNGQVFNAILPGLANSIKKRFALNFLTVPREVAEKAGAITSMTRKDGKKQTYNVEYNEVEPFMKSNGYVEGDLVDPNNKRMSLLPGNLNVFIAENGMYSAKLAITNGIFGEFINPKYADESKTKFKSPTRSETMMQDYAKYLEGDSVGVTNFDKRDVFSPVKNSPSEALSKIKSGNSPDAMGTGEADYYKSNRKRFAHVGVDVDVEGTLRTVIGVTFNEGARISFSPKFAATIAELKEKVKSGKISSRSELFIEGENVRLINVVLDGKLNIKVAEGVSLNVHDVVIRNKGSEIVPLTAEELIDSNIPQAIQMRGYKLVVNESRNIEITEPGQYEIGSDGVLRKLDAAMTEIADVQMQARVPMVDQYDLSQRDGDLLRRLAEEGSVDGKRGIKVSVDYNSAQMQKEKLLKKLLSIENILKPIIGILPEAREQAVDLITRFRAQANVAFTVRPDKLQGALEALQEDEKSIETKIISFLRTTINSKKTKAGKLLTEEEVARLDAALKEIGFLDLVQEAETYSPDLGLKIKVIKPYNAQTNELTGTKVVFVNERNIEVIQFNISRKLSEESLQTALVVLSKLMANASEIKEIGIAQYFKDPQKVFALNDAAMTQDKVSIMYGEQLQQQFNAGGQQETSTEFKQIADKLNQEKEKFNKAEGRNITTPLRDLIERIAERLAISIVIENDFIQIIFQRAQSIKFTEKNNLIQISIQGYENDEVGKRRLMTTAGQILNALKDAAQTAANPGGIDFNTKDMKTNLTGEAINIQFDRAMIEQFKRGDFTGVRPVILNVTPIQSMLPLLGLAPRREEDVAVGA